MNPVTEKKRQRAIAVTKAKANAADDLCRVAKNVVAWLRRLEEQAVASEKLNRGRFDSLADAAKADAHNYRSTAEDVQAAIDAYESDRVCN